MQHFRPYCWEDSSCIEEPEGQLARWLEQLQEYNFTISHRPGWKHQNADSLSRHPCTQCGRESHVEDPSLVNVVEQVVTSHLTEKTPVELNQLQLEDSPISPLLQAVENGEKPTANEVRAQGPEAQQLRHLRNRLVVEEEVLKRWYDNTSGKSSWLQLVLP